MRPTAVLAFLAAVAPALVLVPQTAAADAARGAALAQRWCASCHAAGTGGAPAPDAGPAFATIAADPAYDDARLRGWLSDPHPPMPNFNLTRAEIDDLISHIRSLKPR